MTLFLASVTDPAEADAAVAGGADIVDFKDPAAGALGALDPGTVRAAVAALAGRRPASAVTGDLPMVPEVLAAAAAAMAATDVDYVKIGLFPGPERAACIPALQALARRARLVGVMFADAAADPSLLPLMAGCGFAGAMLDTAHKDGRRLLDHMDVSAIAGFVEACRAAGLMAGLAGSLEPPDIPRLLPLGPDVLGFRGALCRGRRRTARIDVSAVAAVRALIPAAPPAAASAPPAAEGAGPAAGGPRDPIFLRDFTLPVRIGVYGRERDAPQPVRFGIDLEVARPRAAPAGLDDVVSYDFVADTVRMIAGREHVDLVETLAERIAAALLAHPKVARATVRVEKTEAMPAVVGVEITRERRGAAKAGGSPPDTGR